MKTIDDIMNGKYLKKDLRKKAKELNIKRYSKMNVNDLKKNIVDTVNNPKSSRKKQKLSNYCEIKFGMLITAKKME